MKILVILVSMLALTKLSEAGQINSRDVYQKAVGSVVYIENHKDNWIHKGTGFIVEGHLITCNHLAHADVLDIFTNDGKKFQGQVIKRNKKLDIAEVKINSKLPSLALAKSVNYMDEILMIGNPDKLRFAMTLGRFILQGGKYSLFNVRAYGGNSGSPMLNKKGEVVGMCVSAIGTTTWGGKIVTIKNFINNN